MKTILVRLAIAGLCLLAIARTASANVIYDVVVEYEGGYTYSFSMEFANGSGSKEWVDLVGGDFLDESFVGPDGPWTLQFDAGTGSLDFDSGPPLGQLQFFANDAFLSYDGITRTTLSMSDAGFEAYANIPGFDGILGDRTSLTVTLRPSSAVPVAPTAALILAGLAAWRLRAVTAAASRGVVGRVRA